MASRNFYLQVVLRVLLITTTNLGLGFFFVNNQYIVCSFLLIILVLQVLWLINYINQTNRKIAYFFDAIRNEDFTLRFPENDLIKSFKNLNQSLNRVNGLIQEVHLKKQEQEQFYQEILKQADIGILTFNSKGHILFTNPTVEKLLNYKPLNHIKQLAQVDKELYMFFENMKPFERKLFQLTNEREKNQLAIKSTAITIDKQNLLLVVIQDINKELDEKETDSWIKLIRVLTHEIMNTITPMTSISESILNYYKSGKKILQANQIDDNHIKNTVKGLEVIKNQGKDLMDFVQSYRSVLNIPIPDKKIIDVQKLLEKIKILAGQEIGFDNISFEIKNISGKFEIFADEKQITQVLINLSKNAIQSLDKKEGGIIELVSGINNKKGKYIMIKDNGPGISKELIDQIFVPFFTTKSYGSGIGLSLSKQIMRIHGGSLKVHSVPFVETSFSLVF